MESNFLTSFTRPKQKGDDTEATTSAAFVAQPDKEKRTKERCPLSERINQVYSFECDKVKKIFDDAMKNELQLPESKHPSEASKTDDPNYCLYHQIVSHTIEDCYVFKDWVDKQ